MAVKHDMNPESINLEDSFCAENMKAGEKGGEIDGKKSPKIPEGFFFCPKAREMKRPAKPLISCLHNLHMVLLHVAGRTMG